MENNNTVLLAELSGLLAAKQLIELRIADIYRSASGITDNVAAPKQLTPIPFGDTSVLGRDVLGRIKRKRNISPELREKKIALIAAAREKKLAAIAASKQPEAQRPGPASPTPIVAAAGATPLPPPTAISTKKRK